MDGIRVKNGLLCVTYVKQLGYLRVSLPPWSERPGALKVVRSARGDHEVHWRCGWGERRALYRVLKSAAQPTEHTQNLLNAVFRVLAADHHLSLTKHIVVLSM